MKQFRHLIHTQDNAPLNNFCSHITLNECQGGQIYLTWNMYPVIALYDYLVNSSITHNKSLPSVHIKVAYDREE